MAAYTEKLPVQLSNEQKEKIAEELTSLEINLSVIEKEKAEFNKDANENIKSLKLQALQLSEKYQAEGELQDVECYFLYDTPVPGQKEIYRSDTGQLVRVTDMNIFDVPKNNSVKLDLEEDQPEPEESTEPRILLLHEGYINTIEEADFEESNSETPPEVEAEFQENAAQINEEKYSAEQAYNDLPDEDYGDNTIANSSSLM